MSSQKFRSSEMNMSNQPRHELLLVAETVAREKGIEREDVSDRLQDSTLGGERRAARPHLGEEAERRPRRRSGPTF